MRSYFSVRPRSLCSQTLVVSKVSEPKQDSPPPAHLPSSASLHYQCLVLRSCLLSFFSPPPASSVLSRFRSPFDAPQSPTAAPLNCPTSNRNAAQVDMFRTFLLRTHTDMRTHKKKQSFLNGAAAGEISARLHY